MSTEPEPAAIAEATRHAAREAIAAALAGESSAFFDAVGSIESAEELRALSSAAKALSELSATMARIRRR